MDRHNSLNVPILVFVCAFCTRFIGVLVSTFTDLNSYARADAPGFADTAAYIAAGLQQGTYALPTGYSSTYHTWGTFLSPFWLLPGPSRVYARIFMALLGAYAVYNVYLVTRTYGNQQAALLAVTPLIFYPSFILMHSTIHREAAVLFGITMAARLLILPPPQLHIAITYLSAGGFLWFATIFRADNLPVYLVVIGIALAVKYRRVFRHGITQLLVLAGAVVGSVVAYSFAQRIVLELADLREGRAHGRTEYLGHVFPDTILTVIVFSWIGAAYFLFAPFPWMVTQIHDLVGLFEGLTNLGFAIAAVFGFRSLLHRNAAVAIALATGVVLGSVLYGLGTANVGTAVRHRQMVLWVIFILGAIGISDAVEIKLTSRTSLQTPNQR